jgi:amino acid transporter
MSDIDTPDAAPPRARPETTPGTAAADAGVGGHLAKGTLGTAHIVFMVVAAVAPAGGAVAILPLAIALGVGVGTPGMLLVVACALLVFSVGFTRMASYVRNAGAMFSYVVGGLGRPPGLAAAYVAMTSYVSIGCATTGGMGYFSSLTLKQYFGLDVPWWIPAVLGLVLCLVLGYFRITLAAGVLGVALIAEATAVLVLDVGVVAHHGLDDFTLQAFDPGHVFSAGVMGIGIIYAISCFQGFEGTVIYAEEARDPDRTVPRATYLSVVVVGVFFILTSWAMIVGGGGSAAPRVALADPGNFAYTLTDANVGRAWTRMLQLLIVTSSFAGMLAFHNAASRYMFALARDGFMPRRLAAVHRRHASPYVAGCVSFAVMTVIVAVFAVAGLDPLTNLSSSLTGLGAIGVVALLAATSVAVVAFFWRRREYGWARTVAPALAAVLLGTATVLALLNYDAITGTSSRVINFMPALHIGTIAVAVAVALRARRHRPETYRNMGQARIE